MAEYLRQQFIHTRQTDYDITYNMKRAQTIHYLFFVYVGPSVHKFGQLMNFLIQVFH